MRRMAAIKAVAAATAASTAFAVFGFAGAAAADPTLETKGVVREATGWASQVHVDGGVTPGEVGSGQDTAQGWVAYGVPPGPFCNGSMEGVCGPIGPVGRRLHQQRVGVDTELAGIRIVGEIGIGGGAVGYDIPPVPVCIGASCGPIGPVGHPEIHVAQLVRMVEERIAPVIDFVGNFLPRSHRDQQLPSL